MSTSQGYTSPGGGRLGLRRGVTFKEQMEYVKWLEKKGLCVLPEQIVVEGGVVVINEAERARAHEQNEN